MADYGTKASVPGSDVSTIADYLLSYSSSWPLLKVGDTGQFLSNVTHNLGYPPLFFIATASGQIDEQAATYSVSSTSLNRSAGVGSPRYYICRQPLNQNFTSTILPGSSTQGSMDYDYGIKVARDGKSAESSDLRDYALHSGTRAPMVQKIDNGVMSNTGLGLGYERIVPHGLPYVPLAFAFIMPTVNTLGLTNNEYSIIPDSTGVAGYYYQITSTSIYVTADPFFFASPPTIAIAILKNPYTLDTVARTYP